MTTARQIVDRADWHLYLVDGRELRLPVWAQEALVAARRQIRRLEVEMRELREAHILLTECEWFTIPGPAEYEKPITGQPPTRKLFFLGMDGAHLACSLGRGDKLMVGRRKGKR